jgi:hypothetical protein
MFPPALAAVFTVAFAVTGLYSLGRYVRLSAATGPAARVSGQARATELLHLLMSVAMIAMSWGRSGGPETGSGIVQLLAFGVLSLLFGLFAARASGLVGVLGRAAHAVMAAAMVWMVVAMPLLMGHGTPGSAGDAGAHAGHGAMAGMDMGGTQATDPAAAAPPPGWAIGLTVAVVVLLLGSAAFWAGRLVLALRRPAADAAVPAPRTEVAGPPPPTRTSAAVADDGTRIAVLAPATSTAPAAPRPHHHGVLAATCHAVMSVAMAAMLLLML